MTNYPKWAKSDTFSSYELVFKKKWLLGMTIDMWLSRRALWNLAPKDEEVNWGNVEKKRGKWRAVPLEKKVSLVLLFFSNSRLGVKHFLLYILLYIIYQREVILLIIYVRIESVVLVFVVNRLSQSVFSRVREESRGKLW